MSRGHARYLDLAARAIDEDLSAVDSAALAGHLAACAVCRAAADDLRADERALRRLLVGVPSERVRAAVQVAGERSVVRRRSPWAVLAGLAAALILLTGGVGSGAWLVSLRAERLGPADPVWSRAAPNAATSGSPSAIRGLAEILGPGGLRLIAVGVDGAGGRVWWSGDGLAWVAGATGTEFDRGRPQAVAAIGDRVVIVGSSVDEQGAPQATVWFADGTTPWARTILAGSTGLLAAAATPHRIVVAGASRTGQGAPIWSSPDGTSWQAVADPTPFGGATVTGLTAGGPGFVAVGYDDRGGVTWVSDDGLTWSRAIADRAELHRIASVTRMPGGLVAVGFDADGPATWWSQDGRRWRLGNSPVAAGARLSAVSAVVGGLVAIGPSPAGPIAFATGDGRSWRSIGSVPWAADDQTDAIVAMGTGIVVGGSGPTDAAIWVGASR